MGAQEIRRNNPVVVGEKVQKIWTVLVCSQREKKKHKLGKWLYYNYINDIQKQKYIWKKKDKKETKKEKTHTFTHKQTNTRKVHTYTHTHRTHWIKSKRKMEERNNNNNSKKSR